MNSYESLTLNDQAVEGSLLYDCGNPDVRHTEENTVHDNEGFRQTVGKRQQRCVHCFSVKLYRFKDYRERIISMTEKPLRRESKLTIPFFLMMSMAGLIYVCVTSDIPMKQYIMPNNKR